MTSPINIDFDKPYYLQQKLEQLRWENPDQYGDWTTEDVEQAFDDAGLSAWEHYGTYGFLEGIDPSPEFDTFGYLDAKLDQLQEIGETQANGEPYEHIGDVGSAFIAAGLSPLEHFNYYGVFEGITPPESDGFVDIIVDPAEPYGSEVSETYVFPTESSGEGAEQPAPTLAEPANDAVALVGVAGSPAVSLDDGNIA
ncbi:hypothetical protein [Modicisalibacter sp. MOD 31.J]|uniref:hypothetical protein n=1 Tax=Modicisalibacter sp. MOD 31.J TaxID=2831897 RepID=UPI001CCD0777|nr:hypothetical protein [Modicisalibacter sp. MOD 31.J]MBZ9573718.1 hypothetical protein [Modicisalibacter sp. MOD 31.J]